MTIADQMRRRDKAEYHLRVAKEHVMIAIAEGGWRPFDRKRLVDTHRLLGVLVGIAEKMPVVKK